MKFNKLVEGFNVSPQSQNAVQSGPDIGMTSGKPNNTFPSNLSTISGDLLPEEKVITLTKNEAVQIYKALISALKKA